MGTNYYLINKNTQLNRSIEVINNIMKDYPEERIHWVNIKKVLPDGDYKYHIGKSSCGWCFSLHVDEAEGIYNFDDLIDKLSCPYCIIKDEYKRELTINEMISIITERKTNTSINVPYGYDSWNKFHEENGSEPGPNNLLRHKIGDFCVGHGEGTYDYIKGEFS